MMSVGISSRDTGVAYESWTPRASIATLRSVELDWIQVVVGAGLLIGTTIGGYVLAVRRSHRDDPEPVPPRQTLTSVTEADRVQLLENKLLERLQRVEKELEAERKKRGELWQELRGHEQRLTTLDAETITVEEFQAYTNMDGERRERMAGVVGEMNGKLEALLRRVG